MECWRKRRVGVGLRLPLAESASHRARIGDRRGVELGYRPGEAGVRHVAKRASLISMDRQLLVINQELAEEDGAKCCSRKTVAQLRQRLLLNPIDLRNHTIDLSFYRSGKRGPALRLAALRNSRRGSQTPDRPQSAPGCPPPPRV